jgi:hypothetical protein
VTLLVKVVPGSQPGSGLCDYVGATHACQTGLTPFHLLMNSSSSQANGRERLQQAIDVEIKSLDSGESVRELKLRRNTLSPISSLPPEVFAVIFSIVCGKPDYHLARLNVSHVCHRWREITLNQPLLWSHVDFTTLSLTGVAEILVRAKSTPLYLEVRVSGDRWDDARVSTFRQELQAHVPYIRRLRINSPELDLFDSIIEGLVSPAPALEYLLLSSNRPGVDRRISVGRPSIPDTLFDSSTPRLSCLELCSCNIRWTSPLLKRLKYLKILTPSADARPELAVWLDALDEMSQLTSLTLHSASPIAPSFPLHIKRTVTLPSLTRLDILAFSLEDCALALAHLDLPALTSLCLTAISCRHVLNKDDMQQLLPYVARHAHGPQDIQPLRSALISSDPSHPDVRVLAWPVPDIDVEAHDLSTLLAATPPTRVAFSLRRNSWVSPDDRLEMLETMIMGLPLEDLVMVAAHDLRNYRTEIFLHLQRFWLHILPRWPLLQCVRLGRPIAHEFIKTLLEDNGGREMPLLPSLTKLVMIDLPAYSLFRLCNALMKRVEQGVPVETLDLRMCIPHPEWAEDYLQSLSKIGVDVLGPVETLEAREEIKSRWKTVARGPFIDKYQRYGVDYSVTESDED